jgi:hypothetical protein
MANYKAVANGNWSNLAIWQDNSSGSFIASTVLPGASDVVYFNNFEATIDIDVTVAEIRNSATTGINVGGFATISTSRTITANQIVATSGYGNNAAGGIGFIIKSSTSGITINIIANLTVNRPGFDFVGGYWFTGVNSTYNVTGNINLVRTRETGYSCIYCSQGTLNIVGNLSRNVGSNDYGEPIIFLSNPVVALNITGIADNQNATNTQIVQTSSISTATITIVGNVLGSNQASVAAIGNAPTFVAGNITSRNGVFPVLNLRLNTTFATSITTLSQTVGVNATLYTPGVATGHPATTNVRTGIVYGPTNNLTGTCAVPPANTVSLGVPVDNTVGTASLDANALAIALDAALTASLTPALTTSLDASLSASLPAAIAPLLWDEDVANITTPNSIGERLKNCSTVATTGAQIASFNP